MLSKGCITKRQREVESFKHDVKRNRAESMLTLEYRNPVASSPGLLSVDRLGQL